MKNNINDNPDLSVNEDDDELLWAEEDDELVWANEEEDVPPTSSPDENQIADQNILVTEKNEWISNDKATTWKVMVIDDEPEIHDVIRFALDGFVFQEKALNLIFASSGEEAKSLLKMHPNTALIFLDVVMEKNDTGLQLVKYIRDTLKQSLVRIILHTGQPGEAPEESIIENYDINDYKLKSEMTQGKLLVAAMAGLRGYRDLLLLEMNKITLSQMNVQLQEEIVERQKAQEELSHSMQELSELYRTVEQKVVERTAQLQQKNQLLRQIFGRYLSDEIVDTLLETESGLTLGGERREITVLTADIRGFTAQANKLPPEQVIKILNFYLGAVVNVINKYQGTINDFMGDGLLVFFGAPIAREDDPERAIACAIAMQLAMDEINEQVQLWGFAPLEIGIGINTGFVIVGNIGSETRTKYSAIGDSVNLAYRIESSSIGGQILISESTLKKVSEIVKIHSEKTIKPKGIQQPITIYDVEGIGGKYNLYLHKEEEIFLPLQEEISLQYSILDGKQVSDQNLNGTLFKLSSKGALIRCDVEKALLPKVLNNLKMNFNLPNAQMANEDVYVKVLSYGENENTLHVHFTSIPRNLKAQLVALFKIEWTPAFSVNHSSIDEQHKELFSKINKLLNNIGNDDEEGELEILDFLEAYIVTHFSEEETIMKQVDYPHYAAHKVQHTTFIETFKKFKRKYEQNKEGHLYLALRIQQKLINWLVHHVGQSDKKLECFLGEVNN
jgi:hemerythrin-like metal-binding protein